MCLTPIHIDRQLRSGVVRSLTVPCGTCPECLKKRQSSIVVRSYIESCKRPFVCMFTLTYNDEHLPVTEDGEVTLRREDVKNWKKEFRKLISNKDFSWICCGEYSPRGMHRPHYHGIFFGCSASDLAIIEQSWQKYGFTVFKKVSCVSHEDLLNVSRYISKYVVKDEEFKTPSSDVERPRLMSSLNFGYPDERFWDYVLCKDKFVYDEFDNELITSEIVLNVLDRFFFTIDGFKYSIPQYAIRKRLTRKDSAGQVVSSPLLKMVSFFKRFRNNNVYYQEFKSFQAYNPERTLFESLVAFENYKTLSNAEKFDSQRKDIISTYKKSKV